MKKKSKKWYIRANDKLLRELVFKRDNYTDVLSTGQSEDIQPHHWIIGKKAGGYAVRWISENVITVNAANHFKAHNQPGLFISLLNQAKGRVWVNDLISKTLEQKKINDLNSPSFDFCESEYYRLLKLFKIGRG